MSAPTDGLPRPVGSAYTPGPWSIENGGTSLVVKSEYGLIARVCGGIHPDDETLPNARLLASAPELLAVAWLARGALQCNKGFGSCTDPDCGGCECSECDVHRALDKAIATAQGLKV